MRKETDTRDIWHRLFGNPKPVTKVPKKCRYNCSRCIKKCKERVRT